MRLLPSCPLLLCAALFLGFSSTDLAYPDDDSDGIQDQIDNCVGFFNPTQNQPIRINGLLSTGGDVLSYQSSPDGQSAVYLADQDQDGTVELYRAGIDGGDVIKLNTTLADGGNVIDFKITPDGSRVVYRANVTSATQKDLFSVVITGGESSALHDDGVYEYEITSDSLLVVFSALSTEPYYVGIAALYSAPIEGGGSTLLGEWGQNGDPGVMDFKLSPDGQYIAVRIFTTLIGLNVKPGLVLIDTEGTALAYVQEIEEPYDFSPDSNYLVYIDWPEVGGPGYGLRHYSIGEDMHRTLGDYLVPSSFKFTPQPVDGSYYVVFEHGGLGSVSVEGGMETSLATVGVLDYDISTDGESIVYLSLAAPQELFRIPTLGGSSSRLNEPLVGDGDVTTFALSPDGNTAVYRADQVVDERFELFAVAVLGGAVVPLTDELAGPQDVEEVFVIDPDGRTVLYRADPVVDERFELYAVPLDGGASRRINADLPSGSDVEADLCVTSDGLHAMYRADQESGDRIELFAAILDTDGDGDGAFDRCDCDVDDPGLQGRPSEVIGLVLAHTGGVSGTTALEWSEPLYRGSDTLYYDTLRVAQKNGFSAGSGAPIACLESDDGSDRAAEDAEPPAGVFYYLVRAENACGMGSVGPGRGAGEAQSCP
jgi:dipeptidyl aminopeptidase/acylaminoacyl peptidase